MAHKILMVEDDFALAMGTEYALTSEGYAVTTAGNLAQAREKFDDSIDLVLLDVMLPDGTGFEFCKELREKNSDVPIIFLTAVAEEANIVQGLEIGADDYVTKPYRVKELLARVAVNITIALNAILAENFILVKFMGICPFMGVSKKQDTALGMGIAVTFVMGIASAATWAVNEFLLVPLNLVYMQTVVFILVIAALVQLVEMFLQKAVPALYQALGIYLPLITTNCAVLGVALLNIQDGYNFVESLVYGITGGIGFTVAILLFSSVRERLEDCDCPKAFRGFPIALLAAGLLALSFMGFSGFKVFG